MLSQLTKPDSPSEIARFLKEAYGHQRGLGRWLTRLRPYICPMEEVLARIPAGASILDIGCGVGSLSTLAAQFTDANRVLGIDISPRAIAVARGNTLARVGAVSFEVRPPFEFPDDRFDVVLCIDVLHHVPWARQREFIEQACGLVMPGGRLIFKDISPRPRWKAFANRMHDLIMARQWVHHRHEREIVEWLERGGGQAVECARLDRLWYSHYLVDWRRDPLD